MTHDPFARRTLHTKPTYYKPQDSKLAHIPFSVAFMPAGAWHTSWFVRGIVTQNPTPPPIAKDRKKLSIDRGPLGHVAAADIITSHDPQEGDVEL